MRPAAKYYISLTAAAAVLVIAAALFNWNCADGARFAAYLSMAALSSALKIRLPGIHGTISVNFLFVLIGIIDLSFSETVMLAGVKPEEGPASTLPEFNAKTPARPIFPLAVFAVIDAVPG